MVIYSMFSGRQPVFLGEAYKFSPNPLHKTTFPDYVPRHIPTHEKHIERVPYPYKNMRFDHLRTFYVPHTKFEHPYAKYLKTEPVKQEYATTEMDYLGIKPLMEKGSRPNEVKAQMGLGNNDGVKEFMIKNLQEEAGTENTLTRHRDEAEHEGITVFPFEEQYLKFLEEKTVIREHNEPINKQIKKAGESSLSDALKDKIINKHKDKLIPESAMSFKKKTKTVVRPIAPVIPPAPPATTATLPVSSSPPSPPPTTVKNKVVRKNLDPNVGEKVDDIEKRTSSNDDDEGVDVSGVRLNDFINLNDLNYMKTGLADLPKGDNIPDVIRTKAIRLGLIKSNSTMKAKGLENLINKTIKKLG